MKWAAHPEGLCQLTLVSPSGATGLFPVENNSVIPVAEGVVFVVDAMQ